MTNAPAPAALPAVYYLATPGQRHVPPANLGADTLAELEQLHARCLLAGGDPRDPGAALVEVSAGGRIRFTGGASSSATLDSDLVDAVVHAARAGYRLCLSRSRPQASRNLCWLPAGHAGDCEHRGWWRWSLLYGYRGPVTRVCTTCTPHRHVPAPDGCRHR